MSDEVVAIVGLDGAISGRSSSPAPLAYGGFGCLGCGRIVGIVDQDGRCTRCGPLPKPKDVDHMQRERDWIERIDRAPRD